jgi:hypothetical protein
VGKHEARPRTYTARWESEMFRRAERKRRDRQTSELTRAIDHPCRLRLLEMHKRVKGQPLSIETLTALLAQTRDFRDVKAATVSYHLNRLRDVQLLPEG